MSYYLLAFEQLIIKIDRTLRCCLSVCVHRVARWVVKWRFEIDNSRQMRCAG
jgi:hypothetical protein